MKKSIRNLTEEQSKDLINSGKQLVNKLNTPVTVHIWSDGYSKHLETNSIDLADKWVEKNVKESDEEVEALVRKAFREGFHSGAGFSHQLSQLGIS